MTGDKKVSHAQRICQIDDILRQRNPAPIPCGVLRKESRKPKAAQIRDDGAETRRVQQRPNHRPSADIIRPAVQKKDHRPLSRTLVEKRDVENSCFYGGHAQFHSIFMPGRAHASPWPQARAPILLPRRNKIVLQLVHDSRLDRRPLEKGQKFKEKRGRIHIGNTDIIRIAS